jgi:amino acid transporter
MEDEFQEEKGKKGFAHYQKKLKNLQKEYEQPSNHNWYLLALTCILILFIGLVSSWSGWIDFLMKAGFVLLSMSIIFFLSTLFYRKRSPGPIKDDSNADQKIKIMKAYYRLHPAKIAIVLSALAILFIVVKFSFGFTRHSFNDAFENLSWFNRDWEITLVYLACLVYTLYDHNKKYRTLQKIELSYLKREEDFLPA